MVETRKREMSGTKGETKPVTVPETTNHQNGSLVIRLIRTSENGYEIIENKEAEQDRNSMLQTETRKGGSDRTSYRKEGDEQRSEIEEKQRKRREWLQKEIQHQKIISAARREKMRRTTPLQRRLMALRVELEKKKMNRKVERYISTYIPEVVRLAREKAIRERQQIASRAGTEINKRYIDRFSSDELGWNVQRWRELF